MVLAEQIKEMERRRAALERCLGIEQKRIDLRNEEEKTQEPDFWENPDKAREQLRKVAGIKAWVEDYDAVCKEVEDLQLMPDFVKEGVVTEAELDEQYARTLERIEQLEMRNMLRRDEDKLGAILDINAGAGGTEALDWASMLLRMYTRWGEAHGYKVKVLDYQGNQVLLLLLLGTELQDGPGAQRTVNGEHDGGGSAVLSQLLAADDVGQVGQTSAAVLLGDVSTQHAHFSQLLAGVLGELFLLVQFSSDGLDFLQAEVVEHVENFLLHLVQFEIHNFSFLSPGGRPPKGERPTRYI